MCNKQTHKFENWRKTLWWLVIHDYMTKNSTKEDSTPCKLLENFTDLESSDNEQDSKTPKITCKDYTTTTSF